MRAAKLPLTGLFSNTLLLILSIQQGHENHRMYILSTGFILKDIICPINVIHYVINILHLKTFSQKHHMKKCRGKRDTHIFDPYSLWLIEGNSVRFFQAQNKKEIIRN